MMKFLVLAVFFPPALGNITGRC